MANLAASDVTVTLDRDMDIKCIQGMNLVFAQIAFGDGILTYPTGGVPLPVIGNFGIKSMRYGGTLGGFCNGYIHDYDVTNHKLKIYDPLTGAEAAGATTPAATTLTLIFWGR